MSKNDWWCVMFTRKNGSYAQAYKHKDGKGRVTTSKKKAKRSKNGYLEYAGRLTTTERDKAVSLARGRGFKTTVYRGRMYPFLTLKKGELWPKNGRLLRRLNELARHLNRRIHIISGFRSWSKQNYYYRLFLAGKGAPANHPDRMDDHRAGKAADCGVIAANGVYWNLGSHPALSGNSQTLLKKFGLRLPYRAPYTWVHMKGNNEIWHVDAGMKRPRKLPTQK